MKFQLLRVTAFALLEVPDAHARGDADAGQKSIDKAFTVPALRASPKADSMVALEGRCEDGTDAGREKVRRYWEDEGSDCDLMWSLPSWAEETKDFFYPENPSGGWKQRSFNKCARDSVDKEVERIERQCNESGSRHCTGLGDEAAEHVVKDNWCTKYDEDDALEDSEAAGHADYREECKEEAYISCKGNIPNVAGRWCPDRDIPTWKLRDMRSECEGQVDRMVGDGGGDRWPTYRPTRRPTHKRPPTRRPTPRRDPTSYPTEYRWPTYRPTRRPSGGGDRRCIDDERPRPTRGGKKFRFNLVKSNAQCVDDRDRPYEWGQFDECESFSECAERCVNDTPEDLAFDRGFRGYDYDCGNRHCRCLYDSGTMNSRNSGRFARADRNLPGEGQVSGTFRRNSYYCAKLVQKNLAENVVVAEE